MEATLQSNLRQGIKDLAKHIWQADFDFSLERPKVGSYGDLATNLALLAAQQLKRKPQELVLELVAAIKNNKVLNDNFKEIKIAGPGFVNFYLADNILRNEVALMVRAKEKYSVSNIGDGQKVNVEFISANPTGPMTLPNGRGGYMGDCLANVLSFLGYEVSREYYFNDAGNQMVTLGKSLAATIDIIPTEETFYKADYVKDLAWSLKDKIEHLAKSAKWLEIGRLGAKELLDSDVRPAVEKFMKIKFDNWYSEYDNLHQSGKIERTLALLKKQNLTKEAEGAIWIKTSEYGDDEDRVLVKSDGNYGYLMADIAYHLDKIERGFTKLINYWGADHHGHVKKMQAAMTALGYPDILTIVVMQMVTLIKDGQEVRMSKRAGNFVLIDDLIKEVGNDVARFFFIMSGANSHMEFDLGLAKDKSENNPVYYVQYAHARICSILDKIKNDRVKIQDDNNTLGQASKSLAVLLSDFPQLLLEIGRTYELQKLPIYLMATAKAFHHFYGQEKVINGDSASRFHWELLQATKQVICQGLKIMGVSAPEKM